MSRRQERAAIEEIVAQVSAGAAGFRACGAIRWPASALPTCGLALAESERYLPDLIDALDERLAAYGLSDDDYRHPHDRLPRTAARGRISPEIGLVGKGRPLQSLSRRGVSTHRGSRSSTPRPAARRHHRRRSIRCSPAYAKDREAGERFGEFVIRAGFVAEDLKWRRLSPEHGSQTRRMNALVPAPAVRTTCPYCGVGCGVRATPDGQGGAAIAGDGDHPANFGRLCSKGAALGETLGLGTRLLHPMLREDGTLARTDWDTALGKVAGRIQTHCRARRTERPLRSICRDNFSPRTITSPTS
jgi:hypothetical protein